MPVANAGFVETQRRIPLLQQPHSAQRFRTHPPASPCADAPRSLPPPPPASPPPRRPATPAPSRTPQQPRMVDRETPRRTALGRTLRPYAPQKRSDAHCLHPNPAPSSQASPDSPRSTFSAGSARSTEHHVRGSTARCLNAHRARSRVQIQKPRALDSWRKYIKQSLSQPVARGPSLRAPPEPPASFAAAFPQSRASRISI